MSNVRFTKDLPIMPSIAASLPTIIKVSVTEDAITAATAVSGSTFNIPKDFFSPGCVLKVTLGGSKSVTTGTWAVDFYLNATSVLTLTSADATAIDYIVTAYIASKASAVQECVGIMAGNGVDPAVDYAAGSVDMSAGGIFKVVITPTTNDTVTNEFCLIELLKGPNWD